MGNLVGVMQGRLVPKYKGRYQAHPVNYWQDEFAIARDLGLDCIEFILDYDQAMDNPLLKNGGVDEILAVTENTGVITKTVCADYFMEAPLHAENRKDAEQSMYVLRKLLMSSARLGIDDVVIPCVDQSSIRSPVAMDRLVDAIKQILAELEELKINLSLETDLGPAEFSDLLERFDSERITVNYDIGNSAALGFNPIDELDAYGSRITDIHIKDRQRNGGSVILGEGSADFDRFFLKLKEIDYRGPFIMQAFRDDEGVAVFKRQLEWMQPYLEGYTDKAI